MYYLQDGNCLKKRVKICLKDILKTKGAYSLVYYVYKVTY